MAPKRNFTRPTFEEAEKAWTALLAQRSLPTGTTWIFDENLCFEKDPGNANGFKLGFQTAFTPPPPNAERIAYEYFAEFDAPVVFYRIGTAGGRSVCVTLCDHWFEGKGEREGFVRRDEWLMSFFPGAGAEIPEVKDEQRWRQRILRQRPLHDLDFCMTLRAVHEWLAHGRVLTTYERSTLKVLHLWKRILGGGGRVRDHR